MPQIWTTPAVEEALEQHEDQISRLRTQVEQYGEQAVQARALARNLATTITPLRSLFSGIRYLHTASTWQGNAATASRSRLDLHEIRTTQAIRQVDALIDDLEERAFRLEQLRSAGLGEIDDIGWQMYVLGQQQTPAS